MRSRSVGRPSWLRRGVAVGLSIVVVGSLFIVGPTLLPVRAAPFGDIAGTTHEPAIVALANEAILVGYPDGTARPDHPVSRGQLAALLARALDLPAGDATGFTDIDGHVHEPAVRALHAAGVIDGFDDGTFRPDRNVTRGQTASVLAAAFEVPTDPMVRFHDVYGTTHDDGISAIAGAGIAGGFTDGTFRPGLSVTRGQLATFLARGLRLVDRIVEPPPGAATPSTACPTDGPQVRVTGEQTDRYRDREVASNTSFDATGASWIGVHDYPVHLTGGKDICWRGGTIVGEYPDTDSWDRLHSTAALTIRGPRFTVLDVRIHNYGDGINIKDDAADFLVRRAHLSFVRDDCIENDLLHAGLVEDSLLDGCYTGLSARPQSADTTSDGDGNEWIIRRSLIRLEPMPTVFKGDPPGHGRFFKWDKDGRGPDVSLHDNVFRADQPPYRGELSVPGDELASCSNNIMVWLGDGEYPGWLPDCFTVTTDQAVWDEAVAAWHARAGD